MIGNVCMSIQIHAAPVRTRCNPENSGALTLYFDPDSSFPDITMFCTNAELAVDLHAAIQGVIEKHSTIATTGANQEAA